MGRPTSTSSRGGGSRDGYRDRYRYKERKKGTLPLSYLNLPSLGDHQVHITGEDLLPQDLVMAGHTGPDPGLTLHVSILVLFTFRF